MRKKITYVTLKPGSKPKLGKTDLAWIENFTEEQLTANALSDPDNPPLTKEELARMRPVNPVKKIDVKAVRDKMHLSQEKFASYFGVKLRTLQDWEQQRCIPNQMARNFLLVISKEPKMVQRILGGQTNVKHVNKRAVHHKD